MPLTEQQKHELATSSVSAWVWASPFGLYYIARMDRHWIRLLAKGYAFRLSSPEQLRGRVKNPQDLDGQPWASVAGSKEATCEP